MPFETQSDKFFLTEYSDLFLTMGQNLFKGLATILIVWFGIKAISLLRTMAKVLPFPSSSHSS